MTYARASAHTRAHLRAHTHGFRVSTGADRIVINNVYASETPPYARV